MAEKSKKITSIIFLLIWIVNIVLRAIFRYDTITFFGINIISSFLLVFFYSYGFFPPHFHEYKLDCYLQSPTKKVAVYKCKKCKSIKLSNVEY